MAKEPDVTVHVGKQGITPSIVEELRLQVKARDVVKVRLLRTSEDAQHKKATFERLAEASGTRLVKVVGFVGVFARVGR